MGRIVIGAARGAKAVLDSQAFFRAVGFAFFGMVEAGLGFMLALSAWCVATQEVWPGHTVIGKAVAVICGLLCLAGMIEAVREQAWQA